MQELLREEGSVTVGELLDRAGDQTYGFILILLSVITYLPAISTLSAVAIFMVGWQMLQGRPHPWIPKRVQNYQLHQGKMKQSLAKMEAYLRRFGPPPIGGKPLGRRWIALVVMVLAFLAALPLPIVPFANVLPAAGISLMGMALLEERFGLAWLSTAISLFTTVYFILYSKAVIFAIHKGIDYVRWLKEG